MCEYRYHSPCSPTVVCPWLAGADHAALTLVRRRFFLGKNKVMRVALGRDDEDEYRDGLSQLGQALSGSVGLLFTNRSKEDVGECVCGCPCPLPVPRAARSGGHTLTAAPVLPLWGCRRYFDNFSVRDYARMGAHAAETVTMQAGPLEGMTHTMVEQLRKLGMPVELQKGVLHLTAPFTVCREGEVLTVDQARILVRLPSLVACAQVRCALPPILWCCVLAREQKLFNVQMAKFKITPLVMWSEGVCTSLTGQEEKK